MRYQQGVALVTVMLVVAISTIMAVSMIQEQQSAIAVTRGFLSRGQAMQYALGGEELARQILYEDVATGTGRDHMAEVWADPDLRFDFEEGEVNLTIIDLQGRINLNGLQDANPQQGAVRQRLINLFAAHSIDPAMIDRLQDWIDKDQSSRPGGAEDFDYLGLEPPYRTGNVPMQDPSELVLAGVAAEQYQYINPAISTLPLPDVALNINTAPPIVLQSLSATLSIEVAEALAGRRDEEEGFETVEVFLQLPELAGLGIADEALSVQSSFFEVRVVARYQDRFSYLTSVIYRNTTNGDMHVIGRNFARNFSRDIRAKDSELSEDD